MTGLIFHKLILIALIMLLSVNYFLIFSHIRFCVQSIPDEPADSFARFYQWPLSALVQEHLPGFLTLLIFWGLLQTEVSGSGSCSISFPIKLWSALSWKVRENQVFTYKLLHLGLPVTSFGYLKANTSPKLVRQALSKVEARKHCQRWFLLSQGAEASADACLNLLMKEKVQLTQSMWLLVEIFMCEM